MAASTRNIYVLMNLYSNGMMKRQKEKMMKMKLTCLWRKGSRHGSASCLASAGYSGELLARHTIAEITLRSQMPCMHAKT